MRSITQACSTFAIAGLCIAAAFASPACSSDSSDAPATGVGGGGGGGAAGKAGSAGSAGTAGQAGASGQAGSDGGTPQVCTKITIKDLARDPEFGKLEDQYSVVLGTPDPALGTATPDEFQLQLYEFSGTQAPGTFNLAKGNESNFSTCEHCVLVFEDMDDTGAAARYFFQQSGALTLTVNPTPTTGEIKGTLTNVRLVEVEIDYAGKTYVSTPVPGGACLEIESLDIDTTSPPGDAGPDAESDAGIDAEPEAGADGSVDADTDAAPETDAASDSEPG